MMEQKYPIRILHVIGIMNRGGAETMIMNLYRQIDRSKVQFDFVEHTDGPAVFDEEILSLGGKIYHCPRFAGKNYFSYKQWWKQFFQNDGEQYEIIHGHIGSTAGIYLCIAKKYGKYTIAHSHSTQGCLTIKQIIYRVLARKVRYVADCFFACSQRAGQDRFGNNKEFIVLNNAIQVGKYTFNQEIRNKVRKELSIKNEYVIGHVGRFSFEKNHIFLLEIFQEVKKKLNDSKLLLVGAGEDFNTIKRKIHELGLSDSVILTGVRGDVDRLMQAMDVFVFPSLYEGLGIAQIEAQAAGLPCVISDRVPTEGILIKELVTSMDLNSTGKQWADVIIKKKQMLRQDTGDQIRQQGYDISDTAKWLEDFYLGIKK